MKLVQEELQHNYWLIMSEANNRYILLEDKLVKGRREGTLSEKEEDVLLEEMGDLWWEMTQQECDEANERAIKDSKNALDGEIKAERLKQAIVHALSIPDREWTKEKISAILKQALGDF